MPPNTTSTSGLPADAGVEPDPAEHQLHQRGVAVADEVEVEVDDLRDDVDRRRRRGGGPHLDVEVQASRAWLERCSARPAAPTA